MNNIHALSRIITTDRNTHKVLYAIYILFSATASAGIIFTVLKTILYMDMNLPLIVFAVLFGYIVTQSVVAYGIFFMRMWILSIISFVILLDAIIFMSLFNTVYTGQAVLAGNQGLLLSVFLLFFYFTRSHLQGSYFLKVPIMLFMLAHLWVTYFNLQYILN